METRTREEISVVFGKGVCIKLQTSSNNIAVWDGSCGRGMSSMSEALENVAARVGNTEVLAIKTTTYRTFPTTKK